MIKLKLWEATLDTIKGQDRLFLVGERELALDLGPTDQVSFLIHTDSMILRRSLNFSGLGQLRF